MSTGAMSRPGRTSSQRAASQRWRTPTSEGADGGDEGDGREEDGQAPQVQLVVAPGAVARLVDPVVGPEEAAAEPGHDEEDGEEADEAVADDPQHPLGVEGPDPVDDGGAAGQQEAQGDGGDGEEDGPGHRLGEGRQAVLGRGVARAPAVGLVGGEQRGAGRGRWRRPRPVRRSGPRPTAGPARWRPGRPRRCPRVGPGTPRRRGPRQWRQPAATGCAARRRAASSAPAYRNSDSASAVGNLACQTWSSLTASRAEATVAATNPKARRVARKSRATAPRASSGVRLKRPVRPPRSCAVARLAGQRWKKSGRRCSGSSGSVGKAR